MLCICSEKSSSPQKHRVVLPGSLIQPALKECHDALAGGHLGREKTLQKMKIPFWRPNLSRSVKEYCNDCLTCGTSKPRRKALAPLQPIPSGYPMQRLHIVGPLPRTKRGSRFILTVQRSFTKCAEGYAIPNEKASACAKVLVKKGRRATWFFGRAVGFLHDGVSKQCSRVDRTFSLSPHIRA